MVSSWNIAEKDELLKFAPKYFEYMERTQDAPTVLAKIFGFYTFKIKNGTSGQVLKIDVLVMEHLFYNQKITRVCSVSCLFLVICQELGPLLSNL